MTVESRNAKRMLREVLSRTGLLPYVGLLGYPRSLKGNLRNLRDEQRLHRFIKSALGEAANCVDVGANRGTHLAHMVKVSPSGRHTAFEPLPELADYLAAKFPFVDVRQAAVADRDGQASFHRVLNRSAISGLYSDRFAGSEELTVEVVKLDTALDRSYAVDYLKIDVEGAEMSVLLGARDTIERWLPLIAFEMGLGAAATPSGPHGPPAAFCFLTERGYELRDLDHRRYSSDEFQFAIGEGSHWNWLAIPLQRRSSS